MSGASDGVFGKFIFVFMLVHHIRRKHCSNADRSLMSSGLLARFLSSSFMSFERKILQRMKESPVPFDLYGTSMRVLGKSSFSSHNNSVCY